MFEDDARAIDNAPTGGWKHRWSWFLTRGLLLFAIGFGLSWVGYWLNARWIQVISLASGIASIWMLAIAWGEWRRGWWRRLT